LSFTEARIMGKPGDGFDYNYNAQASVDSDQQIIVAQRKAQQPNTARREIEIALNFGGGMGSAGALS
jgi:hypothetical protein